MNRFLHAVVVLALSLAGLLGQAPAFAKRLALVIGNDDYKQFSRLDKAGADAEIMSKELEAAGFEVSLRRDLGYRKMVVAFEEFFDKVKSGDELVVFYAGHGVQTDRGAYLLPVDIEGDTQSQVEKMSYPVNVLFEELDRMKARVSVVIVDACRDNPLRVRGKTIGAARGLSGPDVAKGQMAIFSAGRNQKALDALNATDKNPNGVFTRELVKRMREQGQSLKALAESVRDSVESLAQTVKHEQRPLVVSDLVGDFYLYPGAGSTTVAKAAAPAAPAMDDASREDRFWEDAKGADNVEGYEAYLGTYPNGRYRGLARAHISRLNKAAQPSQVAQNTRGAPDSPAAGPAAAVTPSPAPSPAPSAATSPEPRPAAGPAATPATAGAAPAPTVAPPSVPAAAPSTAPAPVNIPPAAPRVAPTRGTASYALPNGDRYEGDVMGNQRHGKGAYRFANGDRYEGEFANNEFMGQGIMTFANGDRYEGHFQGITKQGKGIMTFANKDRYEGDFADNLFHGQGTFTFVSGERYSGGYQKGLKHGKGEQLFVNKDRYVGLFDSDKPHGAGITYHANGDVFEGEYVQGIKQGAGVYKFANGDRYEGNFVDGLFSGRGRLYLASGDRYEGDFRSNVKEGQGVHYFANKDRYEGTFKNGVQQGQGTHYFANGDKFVGEFVAGVRHGKGTHTFANGQTREIEYVNGVEKKD